MNHKSVEIENLISERLDLTLRYAFPVLEAITVAITLLLNYTRDVDLEFKSIF